MPVAIDSFTLVVCAPPGTTPVVQGAGACFDASFECVDPGCTEWRACAGAAGQCTLLVTIGSTTYEETIDLVKDAECACGYTPEDGSVRVRVEATCSAE